MTGLRQRTDHPARLDWWRGQIHRQRTANLSIAKFCRQLGVSITTFYYWRRRVDAATQTASGRVAADRSARPPIPASAPFVPVSIVDPGADTQLEIELSNACVVRLRGALSPRLLRAAITAAGRLDGSRPGGH
jgi:hypothetical protein